MSTLRIPLSALDLVPLSDGMSRPDAFEQSRILAGELDRSGYHRLWVAEHHGSTTFMASATSVILADLARHTERIRLGSGGVMLPNHAPLMVAEYYGTLATLYGDRFDLGIGRAPGTDPMTAAALRRGNPDLNTFATDVVDIIDLLGTPRSLPGGVRAIPGEGTNVPVWMLGSSTGGAQVAAALGLPYSFASHFAPQQINEALALYREHFDASARTAQVSRPTVMAGVNVLIADTHAEAERLFTTAQLMRVHLRTGTLGPLLPPVDDLASVIPSELLQFAGRPNGQASFVGTADDVVERLEGFVAHHELDELIVTTYTYDPVPRRESYAALAQAWGLDATAQH
ncbi:LLM class flavin-dependent oxidoreductase [Yimella sp. cx-51]|uniref:LLM class flavin-dependent oxidoreductase n=1 Tax=Yimella sp. cx-51 TaxID=2770551 RepID=UPI001FCB7E83|nr:LLM class flavin-dependent oxidoreductase [Yimella sp. cx-51]